MYNLKLNNPEKFERVNYAQINVYDNGGAMLLVNKSGVGSARTEDWVAKNEQGAKMIFGRDFGNGAKWILEK